MKIITVRESTLPTRLVIRSKWEHLDYFYVSRTSPIGGGNNNNNNNEEVFTKCRIYVIKRGMVQLPEGVWFYVNFYAIYLGVLHRFQRCTGHITTGRNQCIQLVKVLYCKVPAISKQLPTSPHEDQGLNCQPQRWKASVLPLCHCWPSFHLSFL